MDACREMSFMRNSLYPRHVGRVFGLRLFLTELSSSLSDTGRSEVVSLSRRHPTFTSGRISLLTCFYKFHQASDRQGCLPEGRQTTPLGADSRPDNESGSVRHRAGACDCVPLHQTTEITFSFHLTQYCGSSLPKSTLQTLNSKK